MKLTKEQLEYELVTRYFELRDGELWRKEYVGKDGRVWKARPAKGTVNSDGYLVLCVDGKMMREHRIIFILTHNRPIKEGYQIHHKYGNRSDNRIEHLEETSNRENNQNKQVHLDGKLVGVCETKCGWRADIRVDGKLHYLGTYETPEDGNKVYLLAAEEVKTYGRLIRTNAERNAAAGAVLRSRRARLRNTEQRAERETLEYDNIRVE